VDFKSLSNEDRFVALESEQVDLLAAGVTHTMERDLFEVRRVTSLSDAPFPRSS
jgi:hypothetical protein